MRIINNMKSPLMSFVKIIADEFEIIIANGQVVIGCDVEDGDAYTEIPLAIFEQAISEYNSGLKN